LAFREIYRRQVQLLIRVLPSIVEEASFALKGGTAINLFVRDMPRLSVDIDLTYLPIQPRAESLAAIDAAMKRIAGRIRQTIPGAHVSQTTLRPENAVYKLLVRAGGVQIKIEVTPVLRGSVYEPELRAVSPSVEEAFGFAEARVVSFADLYAGKMVAALDRQHPRDFFDIRDLLANEGISEPLRRAFLVYLLSHNRPLFEVLSPRRKSLQPEFRRGFLGMTRQPVPLKALTDARETLIAVAVRQMPEPHRRFLLSFEQGKPDWNLLALPDAAELPAVRWRQENLSKLSSAQRTKLVSRLDAVLTDSKKK
jgi:predicted nucleotidyltransferase component of viral defense system